MPISLMESELLPGRRLFIFQVFLFETRRVPLFEIESGSAVVDGRATAGLGAHERGKRRRRRAQVARAPGKPPRLLLASLSLCRRRF